jgi:hypothetical protein
MSEQEYRIRPVWRRGVMPIGLENQIGRPTIETRNLSATIPTKAITSFETGEKFRHPRSVTI